MIELKEWTASEIEEYDDARLELAEDGEIDCTRVYNKFVKQKGGFTVKDITFNGVKLEGVKND